MIRKLKFNNQLLYLIFLIQPKVKLKFGMCKIRNNDGRWLLGGDKYG
jgi:hypothetical protein